jgi:energy-coupling factor transporter ATP-binding protein EcfA2
MHLIKKNWEYESDTTPLYEIENLSFLYPDGHRALSNIDLKIFKGDRIALVGQNGSGKTTLTKHLNGLHLASSGNIRYKGQLLSPENMRQVRSEVGIMFQDPDDHLFCPTLYDDIAFGPMNKGFDKETCDVKVSEALRQVDLDPLRFKPAHNLSFGQKKRAAFASILAMDPEVLILDEPTANLDPRQERVFVDLLKRYTGTLIIISHDLLFLYELCDRVVVLDKGRIHHDYALQDLISHRDSLQEHGLDFTFRFACCHNHTDHHHAPLETGHTHDPSETPFIQLINYTFRYRDGSRGISRVNFHIHEHQTIALVGENGAGKSTLAGCLLGILQGTGDYLFEGELITSAGRKKLWHDIGMVFQDSADQLFCPTCWDEVAFGPQQLGLPKPEVEQRVAEALQMVGMTGYEKRIPLNLSGGERKRLAIAAVLSMQPRVLILDEPSANLDPQSEEMLLETLASLPITKILISHDMFFVSSLSSRTVVMHQGEIIRDYPTADFFRDEHLESINHLDYAFKNDCHHEIMAMHNHSHSHS